MFNRQERPINQLGLFEKPIILVVCPKINISQMALKIIIKHIWLSQWPYIWDFHFLNKIFLHDELYK